MATKEKNKVVAYLRTNKGEVGDQLGDLHLQYQNIIEFAEAHALSVVQSFDDFGNRKKSRLYDVVDYCRTNGQINTVVATTQTRISRSVKDFRQWESIFAAIGVELKFLQQSIMGDSEEFLKSLMVSASKLDSENRSKFIKRGFLSRVQAGYSVQRPPRGYVKTSEPGLYAKDCNTATHLHSNITRFLNGELSYENLRRAVSQLFSSDKLLSRSKFKAVVTNPYYAGYVCYDGKKYKGLHEPFLTDLEHQKLIARLSK